MTSKSCNDSTNILFPEMYGLNEVFFTFEVLK